MSLTWRRNRPYIAMFGVFVLLLIYFGTVRIISYNIGNKGEITTTTNDIENTINLFDDTKMHNIKLMMSSGDYQNMLDTYTETKEKDYYKVDIVIDGVTIENVGVRLKGNSSLMQATGIRGKGNIEKWNDGMMEGFSGKNMMPGITSGMQEEIRQMIGGYGGISGDNNLDYLPLLIRFDKYINGQTYQGHSQIALRKAGFSDTTLLAEPAAYTVYQSMGQPAPETSYGQIQIDGKDPNLYIVSEVVDDEIYLNRYFRGDDGILFKVDSFSSFSYLGDDPTLYTEIFEQATNENDDDSAQLIRMLKFVTESSTGDFAEHIDEYIDVDSVLHILAIDTLLQNNDSFGGAGNNYYLYYCKTENKFYMLTRDQNLSFGGMGGGMGIRIGSGMQMPGGSQLPPGITTGDIQNFMARMGGKTENRQMPPGMNGSGTRPEGMGDIGGGMGGNKTNDLKDRLLANETFKKRYDEIYEGIKEKIYTEGILDSFFAQWTTTFLERDDHQLIDTNVYTQGVEKLKSFLEQRKDSTSDDVNELKMGGGR